MSGWNIDDQPLEYQVRYWRGAAQLESKKAEQATKRKAPERLVELEQLVEQQQRTIEMLRADSDRWQQVGRSLADRVTELETEGAATKLRQERDFWRDRWRQTTRRIGHLLEHQGNVELLEAELGVIRQTEALLTTMMDGV